MLFGVAKLSWLCFVALKAQDTYQTQIKPEIFDNLKAVTRIGRVIPKFQPDFQLWFMFGSHLLMGSRSGLRSLCKNDLLCSNKQNLLWGWHECFDSLKCTDVWCAFLLLQYRPAFHRSFLDFLFLNRQEFRNRIDRKDYRDQTMKSSCCLVGTL